MIDKIQQNLSFWDVYTRKEEYSQKSGFVFGRYSEGDFSEKNIQVPWISQMLVEDGFRPGYPDGKKWAICLTHDIDDICPPRSHIISAVFNCLKQGTVEGLKDYTMWTRGETSPYRNIRQIIELEEKYDAKSTFFFLATERDIKRER